MGTGPSLPLATRRILVVDDQAAIRGVLEAALSEAGAAVYGASDGEQALQMIEASPPDLILLDLAMPGMDGWKVLDSLRASATLSAIPVVLETSAEDYPSFNRAKKLGVAAFISKPFRLGEVIETCRRILEGARPLQGRGEREEQNAAVLVRDAGGAVVAGQLLEMSGSGGQADLEAPLPLFQRFTLTVTTAEGALTRSAEVRWVSRSGGRFRHGFAFRD